MKPVRRRVFEEGACGAFRTRLGRAVSCFYIFIIILGEGLDFSPTRPYNNYDALFSMPPRGWISGLDIIEFPARLKRIDRDLHYAVGSSFLRVAG